MLKSWFSFGHKEKMRIVIPFLYNYGQTPKTPYSSAGNRDTIFSSRKWGLSKFFTYYKQNASIPFACCFGRSKSGGGDWAGWLKLGFYKPDSVFNSTLLSYLSIMAPVCAEIYIKDRHTCQTQKLYRVNRRILFFCYVIIINYHKFKITLLLTYTPSSIHSMHFENST